MKFFHFSKRSTQIGIILASALWEEYFKIFRKHRQSLASDKLLIQVAVTVGRSRLCTVWGRALPWSCSPLTIYSLIQACGQPVFITADELNFFFFSFLNDCFQIIIAGRVERLRQRMCGF